MTKKSKARLSRDRRNIPSARKVSSIELDNEKQAVLIVTKDLLKNQLQHDGPKIARSFDKLAKKEISACSELLATTLGRIVKHLPRVDDNGSKATSARLLASALNSYIASMEVARTGFPREYGALARKVVETLATVLAIVTNPEALEQFHSGNLQSTKCVSWAKRTVPRLPQLWASLSTDFVHIGTFHAILELPKPYDEEDEALRFVTDSMTTVAWLLDVITELVYADEQSDHRYWSRSGEGWVLDLSPEAQEWIDLHIT